MPCYSDLVLIISRYEGICIEVLTDIASIPHICSPKFLRKQKSSVDSQVTSDDVKTLDKSKLNKNKDISSRRSTR